MFVSAHDRFDRISRRAGDRFLFALALLLAGYALCGKGVAYAGASPIYIGELVLLLGLIALTLTRGWGRVFNIPAALIVAPLAILGCIRVVPGVGRYGVDALRDAVDFGYCLFALCVATMIIAHPPRLAKWIGYYRRFIPIFLIGVMIAFALYRFARGLLPSWPGPLHVPIVFVKEGDALVHLAGIFAFWASDAKRSVRWAWIALLTLDVATMGVIDRAGVLSFGAVMILCLIARPRQGAAWRTISMLVIGMLLLYGSMISIPVPNGKGRTISFEQFVVNITTTFSSKGSEGLESTKEWRIDWWKKIIDYTFHGEYFWQGKGYGINLADDDGFQVLSDHSLRSPHSVHFSFLARMGVPGFVLWELVLVVWFGSIAQAWLRARRRGARIWAGLFLFLFAYAMAFIINGSFDVFLEGPMGGIWFWTIYGTGVGALWVHRHCPEVMEEPGITPANMTAYSRFDPAIA